MPDMKKLEERAAKALKLEKKRKKLYSMKELSTSDLNRITFKLMVLEISPMPEMEKITELEPLMLRMIELRKTRAEVLCKIDDVEKQLEELA